MHPVGCIHLGMHPHRHYCARRSVRSACSSYTVYWFKRAVIFTGVLRKIHVLYNIRQVPPSEDNPGCARIYHISAPVEEYKISKFCSLGLNEFPSALSLEKVFSINSYLSLFLERKFLFQKKTVSCHDRNDNIQRRSETFFCYCSHSRKAALTELPEKLEKVSDIVLIFSIQEVVVCRQTKNYTLNSALTHWLLFKVPQCTPKTSSVTFGIQSI